MLASRMIPALWFRLIVLVGFMLFMLRENMLLISLIAFVLLSVTGWQLRTAYRTRDSAGTRTSSEE